MNTLMNITLEAVYTRALNSNFAAGRGIALGLSLAGSGLAAVLLPTMLSGVIGSLGWRGGFVGLALLALMVWPVVFFGLHYNKKGAGAVETGVGTGFLAAISSRQFWTVAIFTIAVAAGISGGTVHLVPLLRDSGVPPSKAAAIASLIGFGVIFGRLLVGWAMDRFFAPYVGASVFGLTALGFALLGVEGVPYASLAAVLLGIGLGGEVDLISYLIARYFGMRHYGVLYAAIYSMFAIGSALGAVVAGRLYDENGNYRIALWALLTCLIVGIISIVTLPRFRAATVVATPPVPGAPGHSGLGPDHGAAALQPPTSA
jgi:predicted MFS family arabinose efflux permease